MKIVKILSLICFLTIGIWAQTGAAISGQLEVGGKIYPNTEIKLVPRSEVSHASPICLPFFLKRRERVGLGFLFD